MSTRAKMLMCLAAVGSLGATDWCATQPSLNPEERPIGYAKGKRYGRGPVPWRTGEASTTGAEEAAKRRARAKAKPKPHNASKAKRRSRP